MINPCCGATYSAPRYSSMNFSAWAYWTDGFSEGSLMPGGHGLRKCRCGNFFMLSELQEIAQVDETEVPYPDRVAPEELPQAIAQARNADIELAARLDLWHHLNHPYRERYRAHRDAEEAVTKAAWEKSNPDTRTWWQRFRNVPPPQYVRPVDSPFTYPPFEPTHEQRDNMTALLALMGKKARLDHIALAELHRELGQFDEARRELQRLENDEENGTTRVIDQLVNEKQNAPMRYRM